MYTINNNDPQYYNKYYIQKYTAYYVHKKLFYMRFMLDVHPKQAEMKSIKKLVLAYKTINRQSPTHLANPRNMTHPLDPYHM